MADMNINAPAGQATAMAPPVRTDDQILPCIRWVSIGKRNFYLDLEKSQSNPICKIAVDLLKHANFFKAFTASSTIPSIYIQQFLDMVQYDKTAGCYRCQLDEQWFVLTKDTSREALQITPVNNNQPFVTPPLFNALINFVNELGYPKLVMNLSNVVTNDMFQPWRALITIINLCLTGKTSGFERPRALDKRNLSWHTTGKKKATLIVIPSIRFTKLIIHHLQRRHRFYPKPDSTLYLPNEDPVHGYLKFSVKGTKREVFGMPIPGSLITADIQEASYYQEYLENVAKHRRYLAGETGSDHDSPASKPTKPAMKPKSTAPKAPPRLSISTPATSAQPTPTSAPAKPQEKKHKKTTETSDKPPKAKKSKYGFIGKKMHSEKALEESMKSMYDMPQGTLPPVVIREPESGKYQPLLEVPEKGKAKVTEEQVTHDLLSLQKPKKKSHVDQYIFQRRTSTPIGSSEHDEPSYAELEQSERKESEKVVHRADGEGQGEGEGQAGLDPGAQAEGQTGSDIDPGNAGGDVQSIPSHVVHAGSDRKHMDLDVADVSPQPSTEQLDEGFTTTAYPKVQENLKLTVEEQVLLEDSASSSGTLSSLQHLSKDISFGDLFFSDKPSEADNDKATAETKVESMVSVTIQQDMSSIPPMTSPIIDLTSRPESPKVHQQFKATTTTTTTLPPPPAQQQTTAKAMMMKRIGKLEHIMPNLIQENKGLEERLDYHGACLYILEQQDILHQVSKAVSEVVTEAVEWAMQAPLRNRFRDLPKADMKEILHQRITKEKESRVTKNATWVSTSSATSTSSTSRTIRRFRSSWSFWILLNIGSAHIPQVNLRQDWWKPLKEEQPATPEHAWSIQSTDAPIPTNNWASALASNYSSPLEDSLLAVDDPILRHNVSKPLPLRGPPGQVTIQSDFFFNKDLEYLRYGSKGSRHVLSISKMKTAYYRDVGLEQMVPDQFWIEEECKYDIAAMYVRTHMRILSVVRIEVFSMYGYDYMQKIVLCRADLNEHVITERDFNEDGNPARANIKQALGRLETTVPQKEETFQVIINVIKNSTCFKAFTISADVPEIFMQQFWYLIKKVQNTDSYEFLLANKKCTVNAEVFMIIHDICLRVEGEGFIDVQDDETTLTFLIDLGYKGPLNRHTNMENVDYPELILEDLAYQIDHTKEKRSRRENMPYSRFTKIFINHFLKQHKSLTNLNHKHYHTIKNDGIVSQLKFVRIESYQVSINYSTHQIPPKKSRGKGKKKTANKRVVKKKVTLSTDDNIISDDHHAALELAKSICQTKAEEVEAARKVHVIHARIVTGSVFESAKKKSSGRISKSVVIQDTPSASKLKPATSKTKLKGALCFTPQEQEAAYIMQALKESKKTSRRQPDEQDSKFSNDDNYDDEKDGDADDEDHDHVSDTQDADDEDVKTDSNEDDIYKYNIRVHKDKDEEMKDVEVEGSNKDVDVISLLDIPIQYEAPQIQSPLPSFTKETPKGKASTKGSKTGKSALAKESVEEPIAEVIMDDAGDDVNNPKGDRYPFDLSKPLPLQGPPGHQTVVADYFFNNELEYLKTSDLEVTYTTFITKTKAARYEIKGIEDMVNKFSNQNVYSAKAILGVKSVSVKKLHGYGHLEEIMVKRSDQQLYKFKEGDFVDLHMKDIKDMLLLAVQHKLFHLYGSDIVDFIMALRTFTRSLILKRRVEDLQFGRVLRDDELYKFSYGTLKSIRDEIHHRVLDFHLDYNSDMPKRKWTGVGEKRSGLMIELIDKQLREREIILNLERLVGARELEMDYKLMTRIV
uniref:Monodehydroascorbate reductase n=1 Tax=Tanacetum cinerariifolium TaxID=118510 RepID=A0A6L2NIV2_TANCI|nr:hypothetical protein [Tanacetum cinerariifolium]